MVEHSEYFNETFLISKLEWFLKDHVTLKTGEIKQKKNQLCITEINCISKYIEIKKQLF